jgi:hypothetical protein
MLAICELENWESLRMKLLWQELDLNSDVGGRAGRVWCSTLLFAKFCMRFEVPVASQTLCSLWSIFRMSLIQLRRRLRCWVGRILQIHEVQIKRLYLFRWNGGLKAREWRRQAESRSKAWKGPEHTAFRSEKQSTVDSRSEQWLWTLILCTCSTKSLSWIRVEGIR